MLLEPLWLICYGIDPQISRLAFQLSVPQQFLPTGQSVPARHTELQSLSALSLAACLQAFRKNIIKLGLSIILIFTFIHFMLY